MSRSALLESFGKREPVTVTVRSNGKVQQVSGVLQTLQHEDGSGRSYNASIRCKTSGVTLKGYIGRFN